MARALSTSELWIRRFHPSPDAAARLVFLPHGGGSASFFFPMSQALSPDLDVLAVQYPGRHDRRTEPALTSLTVMADRIADALHEWTDRPLSLFGHSMGSLLAFEVAERLQYRGVKISLLLVSGAPPPRLSRDEGVHRLPDDELVKHLKELSGTEPTLLDDSELLPMILPSIRSDYTAVETYVYRDCPKLTCPIVVLVGDNDPAVNPEEAIGWQEHTTAECEVLVFPGDHFYLLAERESVLAAVREHIHR